MSDKEWKNYAKGLVKGELAKRNINYIELASCLAKIGVIDTPQNLSNKIARGTFSAVFMLQVLHVINCSEINIDQIRKS